MNGCRGVLEEVADIYCELIFTDPDAAVRVRVLAKTHPNIREGGRRLQLTKNTRINLLDCLEKQRRFSPHFLQTVPWKIGFHEL